MAIPVYGDVELHGEIKTEENEVLNINSSDLTLQNQSLKPITSVTQGDSRPVTSGAVYKELSGKQSLIDDDNKLDADLIDDNSSENQFVTASDKTTWNNHVVNTNNPHAITKTQIGLGNVDDTSDADKPISTAVQTELNRKQALIDVDHKLSADLVNDNNGSNKFNHYIDLINNSIYSNDFNNLTTNGHYLVGFNSTTLHAPITPLWIFVFELWLQVERSTTTIYQYADYDGKTYTRHYVNDAWSAWVEGNTVTTSQINTWNGKQDTLTFDNVPTQNSGNPVKSGGVYAELANKQDALTFDDIPTINSNNPVKSGGIYTAIDSIPIKYIALNDFNNLTTAGLYQGQITNATVHGPLNLYDPKHPIYTVIIRVDTIQRDTTTITQTFTCDGCEYTRTYANNTWGEWYYNAPGLSFKYIDINIDNIETYFDYDNTVNGFNTVYIRPNNNTITTQRADNGSTIYIIYNFRPFLRNMCLGLIMNTQNIPQYTITFQAQGNFPVRCVIMPYIDKTVQTQPDNSTEKNSYIDYQNHSASFVIQGLTQFLKPFTFLNANNQTSYSTKLTVYPTNGNIDSSITTDDQYDYLVEFDINGPIISCTRSHKATLLQYFPNN